MRYFLIVSCAIYLVLTCLPTYSQTPSLGRLFTSIEERAALDRLRQKHKFGEKIINDQTTTSALLEEQAPENVTLNGFVKRSSGKNTTWVNQEAIEVQATSQSIKVKQQPLKQAYMSVTSSTGKRYQLKAGQTIEGSSGKVKEVFEPATELKNVKPEIKE